jgi:hypothetical protein
MTELTPPVPQVPDDRPVVLYDAKDRPLVRPVGFRGPVPAK